MNIAETVAELKQTISLISKLLWEAERKLQYMQDNLPHYLQEEINDSQAQHIEDYFSENKEIIPRIRYIRSVKGLDLKKAKDWVEDWIEKNDPEEHKRRMEERRKFYQDHTIPDN